MHNMTTWQTRLAHGKTAGRSAGKDITITLASRGWDSQLHDGGAYLHIVVGGAPFAELPVEPNLELTFKADTTEIVVKEAGK